MYITLLRPITVVIIVSPFNVVAFELNSFDLIKLVSSVCLNLYRFSTVVSFPTPIDHSLFVIAPCSSPNVCILRLSAQLSLSPRFLPPPSNIDSLESLPSEEIWRHAPHEEFAK